MMRVLSLAGAMLAFAGAGASAACRDDLIKADQNFSRTRSELQGAAKRRAGASAPPTADTSRR
jgi:hypothetical protein